MLSALEMLIFSEVGFQIRPSGNNEWNHNQTKDEKGNNAFNPVPAAAPVDVGTGTWRTHHAQEDEHYDFCAEEDIIDAKENDFYAEEDNDYTAENDFCREESFLGET